MYIIAYTVTYLRIHILAIGCADVDAPATTQQQQQQKQGQ